LAESSSNSRDTLTRQPSDRAVKTTGSKVALDSPMGSFSERQLAAGELATRAMVSVCDAIGTVLPPAWMQTDPARSWSMRLAPSGVGTV